MSDALERWRRGVVAWRGPSDPRVRRRARPASLEARATPGSHSLVREREALPGTVLDVGCGSGGSSLPLAADAELITGVDSEAYLLDALRANARTVGVGAETVLGSWPDVETPPADLVVCHHVLYGVADLGPFVTELTRHARRRVVVEIPDRHPQHALNPLWERFHGVVRPDGPTGDDAVAALREAGVRPEAERWTDQAGWGSYDGFADMVEVVRRRLDLAPERTGEIGEALRELGADADGSVFPGTAGRTLLTIWWDT